MRILEIKDWLLWYIKEYIICTDTRTFSLYCKYSDLTFFFFIIIIAHVRTNTYRLLIHLFTHIQFIYRYTTIIHYLNPMIAFTLHSFVKIKGHET